MFKISKCFVLFIFSMLCLTSASAAFADTLVLPNQNPIHGKITHIVRGIVEMKTENGREKFVRSVSSGEARDMVEIGFFKRKMLTGEIIYLTDRYLEINTTAGKINIDRLRIRNIVLSQETGFKKY